MDEVFLNSLTEGDFGTGHYAFQSLTEGDFWTGWGAETYLVYRRLTNADYNYLQPVGAYIDGAATVTLVGQDLAPDSGETRWQYAQRAVGKDGVFSAISPSLTIIVDSSGVMVLAVGNVPSGVRATAVAGAKIRIDWLYLQRSRQDATPTGFKVYRKSGGSWSLQATVEFQRGQRSYNWTSGALSDGTRYEFIVRTYRTVSAVDHIEDNENVVDAVADSTGPAAITGAVLTEL